MECKAWIDSTYHGSCVDGDGLRSVIFFSGCNLRCPFCHNPETLYTKGREITLENAVKEVLKYKNYIKKGGVTLSGGEPFLQADFCINLVKELKKEGIKVIIETNGTIVHDELISLIDGVRLDVKNQNGEDKESLKNRYKPFLEMCKKYNVNVTFTNVLCPSVNDDIDSLLSLKNFILELGFDAKIDFLPFKKMCLEKYEKLGKDFAYKDKMEATEIDVKKARETIKILQS